MKTIKGPALFLAQFAGDDAPFNSWDSITKWAADCGYKGVQVPSWDGRLIDLAQGRREPGLLRRVQGSRRRTASRSPSCRPTCRASSWPCIRPMTKASTASPRPRCAATRRRGRNGPSTR